MNKSVSQLGSTYIGMQNCGTDASIAMFARKLYNIDVHTFGYMQDAFLFQTARAAWYLKVAFCCWKCEQPSRPFGWR